MWDLAWLRNVSGARPANPFGGGAGQASAMALCGHVDKVKDGCLYGWLWSPADPAIRHTVDVFVDRVFIGQFTADILRDDLKSNGIGDGRYGFVAPIPEPWTSRATLAHCVATTTWPRTLRLDYPPGVTPEPWTFSGRGRRAGRDQIRDMFEAAAQQVVAFGVAQETGGDEAGRGSRLLNVLLGPSPIPSPAPLHGRRLSAFADHVRHKFGMNEIYDTSFAASEFDAFLMRYLESGAFEGHRVVPLSADDLAYLNAPVPLGDGIREITRAAFLFGRDDFDICKPGHAVSDADYDRLVYWWVVDRSRRLHVDDCLVTPEQVERMRRQEPGPDAEFPLSRFMTLFVSRNAALRGFRTDTPRARRTVYCILLLYALRLPHILNLMPQEWLARLGDWRGEDADARGDFGDICRVAIDKQLAWFSRQQARDSRAASHGVAGHRVASARLPRPQGPAVDVQIIGPFQRTLGLGHSCRRLAGLIGDLGYKPNLVDVDLKNDSPREPLDGITLGQFARARVNILHLNAERLPSEIAYLPDVFSNAYNIGVCYWELPTPAECHRLGLALLDELWSASTYMADAARPFSKSVLNIGMPYEPAAPADRDAVRARLKKYNVENDDFLFLAVSDALSWVQRKNPMGAIRAFIGAFPAEKKVKLIIKTHNADRAGSHEQKKTWSAIKEICTAFPRVVFINETFSHREQQQLVATADCLVSLHRAEGFGLDILHAAHSGVPVIATGFSGNLDFCDPAGTWLIPYKMMPLRVSDYAFVKPGDAWADPDIEAASCAMRDVYLNPAKRDMMTDRARQFVIQHFSEEVISRRIDTRLKEILNAGQN